LKNNYVAIENEVVAQWKFMILELKAMVNSHYVVCNQLDIHLQKEEGVGCAQVLVEILADMTLLFDLAATISEE
jgi:hypothetical protein